MIMLVKLVQSVEQLTFVGAVRWKFESFISPTFCQRDGIGRRVRLRSGCLYGVEGSSPSAGISYDRILQRRMTIRLHASFVFVVLSEDSGIFRDTRVFRQGMLKEQSLS